jgi:hypothetical protein
MIYLVDISRYEVNWFSLLYDVWCVVFADLISYKFIMLSYL